MSVRHWIKRKSVWLYSKIVREKATPQYVARGWAIGMFYGSAIPFGFQLLCSIPTAFLLKGSKIGATLGTLLTNHVTVIFIYPAQCYVGNLLIGGSLSYGKIKEAMGEVIKNQDYATLFSLGGELVASFFIGGLLLAAVTTPVTYWGVLQMIRAYQQRKLKKAKEA